MRTLWQDVGRDTRWVMISYVIWGIGEGLWMFVQPLYLEYLGAPPEKAGLVIGMWGLGRLLFILPAGILADKWGTRRLLLPGWYLGLAGVVILAVAPDWRWAAPGFLVYGMSAIAIPVTNLYLTQTMRHDPTRRPDLPIQSSLTLLWAAYSLGIVVTPGIGGWIADQFNWRVVFILSAVWFAFSVLAIRRTTPYPVPQRPPQGYAYRSVLEQWPVRLAFGVLTVGLMGVLMGQAFASQYLQDIYQYSRTSIGVFGSVSALGTAVFSVLLGGLAAWRGYFVALLLVAGSLVLLLATGAWPVITMAIFMLGAHYAARPLAVSVISLYVAEHQRGMMYALVDMLAGGATLLSTSLAGALYGWSAELPFMVSLIWLGGVVVVGWSLLRQPAARNRDATAAYGGIESASK